MKTFKELKVTGKIRETSILGISPVYVYLEKETEKAYHIEAITDNCMVPVGCWLPKSQTVVSNDGTITVPCWLFEKAIEQPILNS